LFLVCFNYFFIDSKHVALPLSIWDIFKKVQNFEIKIIQKKTKEKEKENY